MNCKSVLSWNFSVNPLYSLEAMTSTLRTSADAGLALNRIDGIGSRLDQSKFDSQRELSQAEDLDLVAAINEFQTMQTGYDAALKTYSIVQRMSLFDYVR